MKRAKSGDIRAIEELINIHRVKLYKTARTILHCEDDINDAIQSTLILLYGNIRNLKNDKYFTTWLMRILINECKKVYNYKSKNNKNNISIENYQETKVEEIEDYDFVNKALDKLDEKSRTIAILYYYDEMSVKDISKVLGISIGTVKSRLSRTREKLKIILEKEVI